MCNYCTSAIEFFYLILNIFEFFLKNAQFTSYFNECKLWFSLKIFDKWNWHQRIQKLMKGVLAMIKFKKKTHKKLIIYNTYITNFGEIALNSSPANPWMTILIVHKYNKMKKLGKKVTCSYVNLQVIIDGKVHGCSIFMLLWIK